MANKITKFNKKHTIDYFLDKAIEKGDYGDLEGALRMFRHAQFNTSNEENSEKDIDIRLEIADIFTEMGLIAEAQREYLKLTGQHYFLDEVYFGLIKCASFKENTTQASYYIKKGLEKRVFDDDEYGFDEGLDFELFQAIHGEILLPSVEQKRRISYVSKKDNSRAMDMAKTLLYNMDTALARELLNDVSNNSYQYSEAQNYLALLELSEGRPQESLELSQKLLKDNPNDIYALTTTIAALDSLKQTEQRDEYVAHLDSLEVNIWPEISKVALCFCQINNNKLAHKYLEKSLNNFAAYDRDLLLLIMQVEANLGDIKAAVDTSVLLQSIYPDDVTVKYYAKDLIRNTSAKAKYTLMPELPQHVKIMYAKLLDEHVNSASSADDFILKCEKNPELLEAVNYAFQSGVSTISGKLGAFLTKCTNAKGLKIAKDFLVDSAAPMQAKKEVLVAFIKNSVKTQRRHVILGYKIAWLELRAVRSLLKTELKNAVAEVCGAMFFLECLLEKSIVQHANVMLKKLQAAELKASEKFSDNTLAAVLAKRTKAHKIFTTNDSLCEIFSITQEELERAEKFFD